MSKSLQLNVLASSFSVHRFVAESPVPQAVFAGQLFSVMRTADELSVVCESSIPLDSEQSETGWRMLKVAGPLDFSLTGIMAALTTTLAEAGISLFALSTYDTDYIMVKAEQLEAACTALTCAGHKII